MDRLRFGARARRRARFQRVVMWCAVASLGAMAAPVPGSDAGWNLVADISGSSAALFAPNGNGVETTESAAATMRFRREVFASRPRPKPSAKPETSVSDIVDAAAAEFGIDGGYLLSVAYCESTLNPSAYNAAGYHGLFQFDYSTWAAYGYGSIYDPVAQARTAARLLAAGQASRWPNCA